jgi:hypothetical protein
VAEQRNRVLGLLSPRYILVGLRVGSRMKLTLRALRLQVVGQLRRIQIPLLQLFLARKNSD